MDCLATRTVTTYYIRFDGRDIDVARMSTVLHSDESAPSEHSVSVMGGLMTDLSADEYVRIRNRFQGNFNAVITERGDAVECDDDHAGEDGE